MHLLGLQDIARIGEAGGNVLALKPWIIRQNVGLAPALGDQSDDEILAIGRFTC
jgi:hypothetical protein